MTKLFLKELTTDDNNNNLFDNGISIKRDSALEASSIISSVIGTESNNSFEEAPFIQSKD